MPIVQLNSGGHVAYTGLRELFVLKQQEDARRTNDETYTQHTTHRPTVSRPFGAARPPLLGPSHRRAAPVWVGGGAEACAPTCDPLYGFDALPAAGDWAAAAPGFAFVFEFLLPLGRPRGRLTGCPSLPSSSPARFVPVAALVASFCNRSALRYLGGS